MIPVPFLMHESFRSPLRQRFNAVMLLAFFPFPLCPPPPSPRSFTTSEIQLPRHFVAPGLLSVQDPGAPLEIRSSLLLAAGRFPRQLLLAGRLRLDLPPLVLKHLPRGDAVL